MRVDIDKIIFNELASRRAVALPKVGTLWTELTGGEHGGAPENKLGFSSDIRDGVHSVVDIMVSQWGMEQEQAKEDYAEWLRASSFSDGMEIDGVGELYDGIFTAYEDLHMVLNPKFEGSNNDSSNSINTNKDDYMGEQNNTREGRTWWIVIIVCVVVLAAGWSWWWYKNAVKYQTPQQIEVVAVEDNTLVESDSTKLAEVTKPVAEVAKKLFHVVGGVFSTEANAKKYIAETNRDFPGNSYDLQIMPFKGGKFMVSLYGADSERDAANRRNRIEAEIHDYELWVYKADN